MINTDNSLEMRILAIGDFDDGFPRELRSKLKKIKPDLILSPGDICYGKKIRDIIFKHYEEKKTWYDFIGKRKARKLTKDSIERSDKILEFLNSFDVPVYLVYGNHDKTGRKKEEWTYLQKDLFTPKIRKYENIKIIDMKAKKFGNYYIIGYGQGVSSPELPQYKEETDKKELKQLKKDYYKNIKKVRKLFKGKDPQHTIFLTHNVPHNTKLDKITSRNAPKFVRGKHYGSLIARKIIDRYQPALAIGGHMHEGFGKTRLRRTLCINSGPASKGKYAVIDIKDNKPKVKFYKLRK